MSHLGKRRDQAKAREAELERMRRRWQVGVGAMLAVVGMLAWLAWPSEPVAASPTPNAVTRLRTLLAEFSEADQSTRTEIVARCYGRRAKLIPDLAKVVADAQHPQRLAAADLSAMLKAAASVRPSYRIVSRPGAGGGGGGRRSGGGAAHSGSRGKFGDLSEYGFAICRGQHDPDSLTALLDAFDDHDSRIRMAALRALPSPLPASQRRVLMGFAQDATGFAEPMAVAAVAKQPIDEQAEAFLIAKLGIGTPVVRKTVLEGLARKSQPLTNADVLYRIALDTTSSLAERARAVRALDATRSLAMVDRLEACSGSPELDYYVGRCLISAGRLSGLKRLIRLLVERSADGPDQQELAAIEYDCRRVLGAVSGLDVSSVPSAFGRWLLKLQGLEPQVLPPARVAVRDFDA